jgi:hypothetical protein
MAAAPAEQGYYWGSPGTKTSWRQTEYASHPKCGLHTHAWVGYPGRFGNFRTHRQTPGGKSSAHGYIEAPPLFPVLLYGIFSSRLSTAS